MPADASALSLRVDAETADMGSNVWAYAIDTKQLRQIAPTPLVVANLGLHDGALWFGDDKNINVLDLTTKTVTKKAVPDPMRLPKDGYKRERNSNRTSDHMTL